MQMKMIIIPKITLSNISNNTCETQTQADVRRTRAGV